MPNYIYFLKHRSRIKIGVSRNVDQRVKDIGKHLPSKPKLLGSIRGTYALEKHIHQRLQRHWIRNEWFRDCADVRHVAQRVLAGDDLGFVPTETALKQLDIATTEQRTPAQWLEMINNVCGVVWPNDPAAGIAAAAEIPVDEARAYLDGTKQIPRPINYVIAAEVVKSCMEPWRSKRQ